MILEMSLLLGLFVSQATCQYGHDMDDSDYQVTVQQHGDAGQKAMDKYGKAAAQGCVNGAAAGAAATRTPQGAAAGCVAGACGNVAQKAVWPKD